MQKIARFYGVLSLTVLCGCAVARTSKRSEAKLAQLKTGDSREQVIRKLGPPTLTLSTATVVAVQYDQYRLFPKKLSRFVLFSGFPSATIAWWKTDIWEAEANVYWLKYVDHKLEKWGRQADFASELPIPSTSTMAAVAASTSTITPPMVSTSPVSTPIISTQAVSLPATSTEPVTAPVISTITTQ